VGDLARTDWIANVEYANTRVEIAAGERRRLMNVVDAAVMAAIREYGKPGQVRQDLVAIGRVVRLQHHLRNPPRIRFVADVNEPRKGEGDLGEGAGRRQLPRTRDAVRAAFVHEDDVGLLANLHVDRMLCSRAVLPCNRADERRLRIDPATILNIR